MELYSLHIRILQFMAPSQTEVYPVKMRNPKILILTARFGEGHLQASIAIRQSFAHQGIDDVTVIDLLNEAHPLLNTISRKVYITSMRTSTIGLDYYGWSYYMTRNAKHHSWSRYFTYIGQKKLKEILQQHRPDAIINVFPFGAAPEIAYGMGIRSYTVLTDYALHARWLHPSTDKYYVATNELKDELVRRGFENDQVEVTGIPIRKAFERDTKTDNAFSRVMNSRKKTVLITAGAYGVSTQIADVATFLLTRVDCQIAIVCGRNQKMEASLREKFTGNDRVYIFGFEKNIQDLMAVSSCIVTKAGGLTLSEALASLLPVFIFKPLGGQEKENAVFFQSKGIAMISNTTEQLEQDLDKFLSHDTNAEEIKSRMAALRQEHAADRITKDILLNLTNKLIQPV